jgi:hypothetical protein
LRLSSVSLRYHPVVAFCVRIGRSEIPIVLSTPVRTEIRILVQVALRHHYVSHRT